MAYRKTRLIGALLGAFFIYRYPLAALMVLITIGVTAYLINQWTNRHEEFNHRGFDYGARLGSARGGPGRRY